MAIPSAHDILLLKMAAGEKNTNMEAWAIPTKSQLAGCSRHSAAFSVAGLFVDWPTHMIFLATKGTSYAAMIRL